MSWLPLNSSVMGGCLLFERRAMRRKKGPQLDRAFDSSDGPSPGFGLGRDPRLWISARIVGAHKIVDPTVLIAATVPAEGAVGGMHTILSVPSLYSNGRVKVVVGIHFSFSPSLSNVVVVRAPMAQAMLSVVERVNRGWREASSWVVSHQIGVHGVGVLYHGGGTALEDITSSQYKAAQYPETPQRSESLSRQKMWRYKRRWRSWRRRNRCNRNMR